MGRNTPWLWTSVVCVVLSLLIGGCTREKPMATPTPTRQAEPQLSTPSPIATPVSTPEPPKLTYYTVQPGDTVWGIAESFGVPVEALVEANSLSEPDRLQPGTELVIPVEDEAPPDEVPGGEPSSVEVKPTEGQLTHTVSAGENLWSIAQRYGTTVDEIAALNELDPEGILALGQELLIP